jgi:hypothetical protein
MTTHLCRPPEPRRGGHISAQGKRSVALGGGSHRSKALKGRSNRPGGNCRNPLVKNLTGACARLCRPFRAFLGNHHKTQGDASRLTPLRLPWADMSRPFGAEHEAVFRKIHAKPCQAGRALPKKGPSMILADCEELMETVSEERPLPSRSDVMMVAVGFNSRVRSRDIGRRRVATVENKPRAIGQLGHFNRRYATNGRCGAIRSVG